MSMRFLQTTLLVTSYLVGLSGVPARSSNTWKLLTNEPGIYEVFYADLKTSGFPERVPLQHIALLHQQTPVHRHIEDNGNGIFDEGDRLIFYSAHLGGDLGYHYEHSKVNVYLLTINEDQVRPYRESPLQKAEANAMMSTLNASKRLEVDTLAMQFASRFEPYDMWYWRKLSCVDKQAFSVNLDLYNPVLNTADSMDIAMGVRGFSYIRQKSNPEEFDHLLRIAINQVPIDKAQAWNGKQPETLPFAELPTSLFKPENNTLEIRVPRRTNAAGQLIIDVTILNWVQIHYKQYAQFTGQAQATFSLDKLTATTFDVQASDVWLFSDQGTFWRVPRPGKIVIPANQHGHQLNVTPQGSLKRALDIQILEPLELEGQAADYLMIAHRNHKQAVLPLAQLHRERGLEVKVVDVAQIYDTFNGGIIHPQAIKDYIAHAYHHWRVRPRFVLLVGDASYDTKNTQIMDANYPSAPKLPRGRTWFSRIPSTKYKGQAENNRNLIPSFKSYTKSGHAASDNYFVTVEGDDFHPDLAIGRLTVVTPEETRAIVQKTIDYIQNPPVGPLRLNMLMITNEQKALQTQTNLLAQKLAQQGFISEKVYPQFEEQSNEHHSENLLKSIEAGQFAIYFHGHGGRFIWRTGPPQARKDHDLFTIKHVESLKNKKRYPIVFSFTCFSAPFDHPSADSIGESFMRLDQAGAVAFYGASWRNAPRTKFNTAYMQRLNQYPTLGEAILATKRENNSRLLVEGYNLLGDPALPLRPLKKNLALSLKGTTLSLQDLPIKAVDASAILMYRNQVGDILARKDLPTLHQTELDLTDFPTPEQAACLQLYVWNQEREEAFGSLVIESALKPGVPIP